MAGNLASFLPRWKEITTDRVVLQAIASYRLRFLNPLPRQDSEPIVRISRKEQGICNQEIRRLISMGVVESVLECKDQFLSPFFVIEKSSGG